jgi:hypothetical protein
MHPKAQEILDKVIGQITGYKNPFTVEQFMQKYAFDVRMPVQVHDSTTGEATWAQSANPTKFITMETAFKGNPLTGKEDWLLEKQPITSMADVLETWQRTNFTTTQRKLDSLEVYESDNVYESENVHRSLDIHNSKNILFCDTIVNGCEYVVASQRSQASNYCARLEDSKNCSQSFNVSWSGKIVNSAFIHDSFDLYECLFCSHLNSKRYCVAEYFEIKKMVMEWLLTS